MRISIVILAAAVAWSAPASEEGAVAEEGAADQANNEERRVPLLEISFGDSTLFAPKEFATDPRQVIPTSSALFIGEYFLTYAWRIIAVFNLPLTTEQVVLENGDVQFRKAAPTLAAGLNFSPWGVDFAEDYRLEVQFAVMAGFQLRTDEFQAFPLLAARLYLLQSEKLGLYLGSAFAVLVETAALIWGLAYRF